MMLKNNTKDNSFTYYIWVIWILSLTVGNNIANLTVDNAWCVGNNVANLTVDNARCVDIVATGCKLLFN